MHVLMLGAGAMGSLLGARLSRTGVRVSLLSTNRQHMEAVEKQGLLIEELDGTVERYRVPSYSDPRDLPDKADWVILMVKTYDTDKALASMRGYTSPSAFFLTLQNGIGNWERIAGHVGRDSVLVGITAQGATLVEPGKVRHGGNGHTYIGEPEGPPSDRVRAVADLFRRAGLHSDASDGMQRLVWEKLMINTGINAITALTGIRNGGIAVFQAARDLCRSVVEEALQVAAAKGFPMGEDMVERVLGVAAATAVNRSSMGQDVDRRKRTEIDAINGAIVQYGMETQTPIPVNLALTQLVKVLESSYLGC